MTPDQIAAFEREQQRTDRHPLTCGFPLRHQDRLHKDGEGVLTVDSQGPVCPYCGWRPPAPPEPSAWPAPIPVSERLPPDDPCCIGHTSVQALCWSVDDREWLMGHYDHDTEGWNVDGLGDRSVTHWLALPPAVVG